MRSYEVIRHYLAIIERYHKMVTDLDHEDPMGFLAWLMVKLESRIETLKWVLEGVKRPGL